MTGSAPFRHHVGKPAGVEVERLRAGVGAALARERARVGLTQAALAARARVTVSTVALIEQGRSRPSWSTLVKVAAALHPHDSAHAGRLAHELADAAGPSLAGPPGVPYAVARELLVDVLGRSLRALGLDVDDDRVRHVVVEQIRAVVGGHYLAGDGPPALPEAVAGGGQP